jgi:hypothetical protein
MKPIRSILVLILLLIVGASLARAAGQGFYAFSLGQAQHQMTAAGDNTEQIRTLAGITRLVGMVVDESIDDVILVGQNTAGRDPINLDDLVVAMRAVLVHNEYPYVSIDRTAESDKTGQQAVHFKGGIENTQFGHDLLAADITLKKLSLGLISAQIWGVESYLSLSVQEICDGQANLEDRIGSRFWFYPKSTSLSFRRGVFVIFDTTLGIETRVQYAIIEGKTVIDLSGVRDKIGDRFSRQVEASLDDLGNAYPEIQRLKTLLDLVAVAVGMRDVRPKPNVIFWLKDYVPRHVSTLTKYDLIRKTEQVKGKDDRIREVELNGGITLNPIVLRLRAGDVEALRDAVIKSRPTKDTLTWKVPIDGWHIPGAVGETDHQAAAEDPEAGWSLDRSVRDADIRSRTDWQIPPPPPPNSQTISIPDFRRFDHLPSQGYSSNVGGIMLQGVARVTGQQQAQVDLNSGYFSLVVDGKNASLSPGAFRKFVTALWAVYYSNQDPGISIDPIAPGVNKHMVRYIGKVINSDLGRVMREADYLMKQWAVGTGRPDIPGFQNPDDIAAQNGVVYVGAMSRFWFVPEDMRFRRADNLLLFERGRMVVKTEFMFNNDSMRADPANERFAQFFTEHYTEIAQKYPVYKELFEYAKMVSIAKYLKESGVPLLWFLMANKDLVLTEDSPGTVDALAKGSDYFKNITIEGGVDLATQGHYVYDAEAMKAINEAISKYHLTSTTGTSLGNPDISRYISDRFSFDLAGQAYSVLPQHSLTCGKDRRGIRYQTDIAFRDAGFCLTEQALDELEVRITRMIMARTAGQSAQLSENASEEETLHWYQTLHERAMEQVKPIQECLKELKDQKYPTEQEFARAIDKALAYRGEADWIKPMVVKQGYYNTILELVRYFNPNQRDCGEFGEGWHLMVPYRIRPAGQAKKELNGVLVPEQMAVQSLVTGDCETLTFSTDRYSVVGYVPDRIGKSHVVGLFIMSDASLRLVDKLGNEFWFDSAGRLTDMVFSEHHHTHFEYAKGFVDPFDQAPYRVESAGRDRVQFQGVSLPKTMTVVDNANGSKETLVFEPNGAIVGYTSENQAKTRFRVLALLSDLSFRLLDKSGNEVAFSFDGRFEGLSPSLDNPMVKSVCVGPYKVDFGYTMGPSGSPMIASARLSKRGSLRTLHAVHYEYDKEGRLCDAKQVGSQLVQAGPFSVGIGLFIAQTQYH